MKAQSGFTLIELLVVVTIIGIVSSIAIGNFFRLNEKKTIESNIKEIYSILMRARNTASNTNTPRLVVLGANQLQTGVDADGNNVIDGTPTIKTFNVFPTAATPHAITSNVPPGRIRFDRRGLTSDNQTISITGFPAGIDPAMDCIVISATRINMGRMTGGACVQR